MLKTVREVMTGDPVTLDENATIAEAARQMRDRDIGDVLVLRNGKLCGIVTDRDIVVRGVAANRPWDSNLGDICSREPITVTADDPIESAISLMRQHAIRRLPVTDEGAPVGVVSLGDLAETREPWSVLGQISEAAPNH